MVVRGGGREDGAIYTVVESAQSLTDEGSAPLDSFGCVWVR